MSKQNQFSSTPPPPPYTESLYGKQASVIARRKMFLVRRLFLQHLLQMRIRIEHFDKKQVDTYVGDYRFSHFFGSDGSATRVKLVRIVLPRRKILDWNMYRRRPFIN